jgi:hypothetical protein
LCTRRVAELAPIVKLATSVAVMECVNVSLTVTTNTVVMMVVEVLVELVKMEPSAKVPVMLTQDNATLTV